MKSLFQRAGHIGAAVALLALASCSGKESQASDGDAQAAASEENSDTGPAHDRDTRNQPSGATAIEGNVQADALAGRPAGYYQITWSGDDVCGVVVAALNEGKADANGSGNYADTQARLSLGTQYNVEWAKAGNVHEAVALDYFGDGAERKVQRRSGMLSGNQVITLWIEIGDGEFTHLDFGHAGTNTTDYPAEENLHTKLTYSVADIVSVSDRHVTLVAPLRDFDASGDVFGILWSAKEGRSLPLTPQDYYPYIACAMTPVSGEE